MQQILVKERRLGADRRTKPTSPFTLTSLRGSRTAVRRKADQNRHYYVDLYPWQHLLLLSVCLLLSLADAFLTLYLLSWGGVELNPVMSVVLQAGALRFVLIKYILTAFGLTCLLMHKNYVLFHGRMKVENLLLGVPFLYLAVLIYEVLLIVFSPVSIP